MLSSIPGRGVLLSTGTADDKPFDAHQNQGLPSTFIVKILQPSGSTLTLDAAQRSTIADIKADIERLAGIQAQLQTLYVSSSPEPLESGSPVKQYANGDDDLELTLIVVPFAPTGTFWWASDSFAQTNFRRPEWFHFEPVVAKHQGGEGAVVGAEEAGPAKKLTLKEKMAAKADAKKKKAMATTDELKKEAEAKAKEAQSNLGEHPQGPEHRLDDSRGLHPVRDVDADTRDGDPDRARRLAGVHAGGSRPDRGDDERRERHPMGLRRP